MKSNKLAFSSLAAGVLAVLATPQLANSQAAPAIDNPLNLPQNIEMLGQADPNVRSATAVVNGYVITGTDVEHRAALLVAASEQEIPEAEMQRVRMQVMRNLIDETLQIQAAQLQELAPDPAQVEQTYARLAQQNFGQSQEAMETYLTSIGSSAASLKRQILGELSWQRLLQRNVSPFVSVSDEEVNELIERLEASRGTNEYRLGEIFLAATPETEASVEQNGRQIVDQLRQGGSFVAYARQFSQASTAAVGGDLGWVRLGQLPEALATVAREMQPGQLVGPIRIPGGFSILYLIDRRQVLTADPRDAVLSLKQISISFEPGISEADAQARVAQFNTAVQSMRGCGDAENVAATIGAQVVTNDQLRARSLPEALQGTILNLQLGQTTPPFGSVEEGVRVLMLCGRDDPEVEAGPDFNRIMSQLEDERIDKRAQRYLRDLRNDAYIEYN